MLIQLHTTLAVEQRKQTMTSYRTLASYIKLVPNLSSF